MPNAATILAPVILVGPGRSGTSLISNLFARHPDCAVVGETANLIFGVWHAMRVSASYVPPLVEHGRPVADDERAGRLVRQAFVATFPDDRPRWMQKPIGVPKTIVELYPDDPGCDEAAALFWRVLRSSFPEARYVTVLRHPCDVVLSGVAHWGKDERTLWRTIADLARFVSHPDAPPAYAVRYERLVSEREPTVRALCEATALPFDAAMLGAFDAIHVAAPGREEPALTAYSRRHEWAALDPKWLRRPEREAIDAMFERFGERIEWPPDFSDAVSEPGPPASDAERAARLEALVAQLKATYERNRMEQAERWRQREEEFGRLWREQRDWIAELERGKAWLEEQVGNWRAEAERLQRERSR